MDHLGLIVAVAVVTYATRVVGFTLVSRTLPPRFDRFLRYVPVAVFAALVAPGVGIGGAALAPRLVGAAAAVVAMRRTGQLWAGLAAGMGGYWLVRLVSDLIRNG